MNAPSRELWRSVLIVAAVSLLPFALCCGLPFAFIVSVNRSANTTDNYAPAARPQKSKTTQARRRELISRLTREGVFSRVEPRLPSLVRVYVGPAFADLPIDAKQSFTSVVFAYYLDGELGDAVILHDGRTGKRIGVMQNTGLRMD